MNRNDPLDWFA